MTCFSKRTEHFDQVVWDELIDARQYDSLHTLEQLLFLLLRDELIGLALHEIGD